MKIEEIIYEMLCKNVINEIIFCNAELIIIIIVIIFDDTQAYSCIAVIITVYLFLIKRYIYIYMNYAFEKHKNSELQEVCELQKVKNKTLQFTTVECHIAESLLSKPVQ